MKMFERKKVYFNLRLTSRERMIETVKQAEKICDVLLPKVRAMSSVEFYRNSRSLKGKIKAKFKDWLTNFLINEQFVDRKIAEKADLVYIWGATPRNYKGNFIVELDNPFCLAYYHKENFLRKKEEILSHLKKAFKITCLSLACKNHLLEFFPEVLENKTFVFYPYVERRYKEKKREEKTINFIFVGLDARIKGILELLEAFSRVNLKNIKLFVVSHLDFKIKKEYEKDKRITFLEPKTRIHLLKEVYPKMDIMIFPSFCESFGVVLLEALSFGMGIIAVNVYATPEIVKDRFNGRLLHHPIIKPSIFNGMKVVNPVDLTIKQFYKMYLAHNEFYHGLYQEIKEAIVQASENYKNWQKNSVELFEEKFSPEKWRENFRQILYF